MPLPDSTGRERTVGEVLNLLVASKSRPRANKSDGPARRQTGTRRTSAARKS
jgi:hypothetical protein